MAKNKSFNKLMAGTMTAAMVAGVVAPVAASAERAHLKMFLKNIGLQKRSTLWLHKVLS